MARNDGTLIIAPIRPTDSMDAHPVAFQSEIRGGHHSVPTLALRDAIPAYLREAGMTCAVAEDDVIYKLAVDLATWAAVNSSGDGGGPVSGVIDGNDDGDGVLDGNDD